MEKASLQPHQERMLIEYNDLKDKTHKLELFINDSPIFKTLEEDEQKDMRIQLNNMQGYLSALKSRCERQGII